MIDLNLTQFRPSLEEIISRIKSNGEIVLTEANFDKCFADLREIEKENKHE